MPSDPYPKSAQLARGARRTFRKVASPEQWATIRCEKLYGKPCRVCGHVIAHRHLHHLVPRARGGDDVADNLVTLCVGCHERVTRNDAKALALVSESLTVDERAYVHGKLGVDAMRRLFGV